jgi:hypothetical protein
MYNTLELGFAGSDEWLAASAHMTLLNEPCYELTCSNLNHAFESSKVGYDSTQSSACESANVLCFNSFATP